jgi:hypothetical protein
MCTPPLPPPPHTHTHTRAHTRSHAHHHNATSKPSFSLVAGGQQLTLAERDGLFKALLMWLRYHAEKRQGLVGGRCVRCVQRGCGCGRVWRACAAALMCACVCVCVCVAQPRGPDALTLTHTHTHTHNHAPQRALLACQVPCGGRARRFGRRARRARLWAHHPTARVLLVAGQQPVVVMPSARGWV